MWDNTNVDFQGKASDLDLQRLTFSLYYGGNVAKGGIFLQLCGWLGIEAWCSLGFRLLGEEWASSLSGAVPEIRRDV